MSMSSRCFKKIFRH